MDRGAWWATVHGVAKSCTRLSDFTWFKQIILGLILSDFFLQCLPNFYTHLDGKADRKFSMWKSKFLHGCLMKHLGLKLCLQTRKKEGVPELTLGIQMKKLCSLQLKVELAHSLQQWRDLKLCIFTVYMLIFIITPTLSTFPHGGMSGQNGNFLC